MSEVMSTKIDATNMNKSEPAKNDWGQDDEDDNWDDWGDAEDNFEDSEKPKLEVDTNNAKIQTSVNYNANIQRERESTTSKTPDFQDINCNKELNRESITTATVNATATKSSGWGGLFGGVVSALSTASEGLGNITSTVSQGLNQVIGVPDPEELARMQALEATKVPQQQDDILKGKAQEIDESTNVAKQSKMQPTPMTPVFGLNLVSGVTTLGSKVLNTGLDTLEGIGKKTMNILQENDPLLMNKRKLLGLEPDRPNLSEVLKEAKKDADQLENTLKELKLEKSREMLRFELLFENNCGLVHLEALEILSKESELKLQSLQDSVSGNALVELQETINEVKELMELEDLDGESDGDYTAQSLSEKLHSAIEDAELQIGFDDIANNWSEALVWITSTACNEANVQDVFAKGITTLSETCALEMNKLHKIAELLLVKEHHSTANEVDCIVQLCKQFNTHLNGLTNRFAAILTLQQHNSSNCDDEAKPRISTLFAEMLVATQQIEKAFKLFLPILQIGAV